MTDHPPLDPPPDPPLDFPSDVFYNRAGEPIDFQTWAELRSGDTIEDEIAARQVAFTVVGKVEVSTVWIGMDIGLSGRPLIFETMVFDALTGDPIEDLVFRYATEDDARAGHAHVVEVARGRYGQ